MTVIIAIVKWLLPLYRLFLSLSIIIHPVWYITAFQNALPGFSWDSSGDVLLRGSATLFIGCAMLEHIVVTIIQDNLIKTRHHYIPALFASDVAILIFMIELVHQYDLTMDFMLVGFCVPAITIIIRMLYVCGLMHDVQEARLAYNTRTFFAQDTASAGKPAQPEILAWPLESEPIYVQSNC